MADSAHTAFIRDCRDERKVLIGRIEAMEGKTLQSDVMAMPPADMAEADVDRMKRAIAFLDGLIAEYEARQNAKDSDL